MYHGAAVDHKSETDLCTLTTSTRIFFWNPSSMSSIIMAAIIVAWAPVIIAVPTIAGGHRIARVCPTVVMIADRSRLHSGNYR